MRQPELGQKIVELRKMKNLTQEDLAAECNLNVRSIQRIEKGEVEPRAYTLKVLSEILEYEFGTPITVTEKEKTIWLVLTHLTNFIPLVIIPLLIWIVKKDEIPEIDSHAKDCMNFQISLCIYMIISSILVFLVIGIFFLIIIGIFTGIITLINTIKVAMGNEYVYPFTIRFIN